MRAVSPSAVGVGEATQGGLRSTFRRRAEGSRRGSQRNLSNTPFHPADLGTDNYEQEVTLSLLENDEQVLEETAAALERIERGTFGVCENCNKEIGRERLQAVPYARYCINCARKLANKP